MGDKQEKEQRISEKALSEGWGRGGWSYHEGVEGGVAQILVHHVARTVHQGLRHLEKLSLQAHQVIRQPRKE
jgi:hypothetical protein